MPFLGTAGIGGLIAFLKKGALPTVLGGVLSEDSTYFYRTFTGSGTLTVASGTLTADVLVIAGGGGGSNGGGGAGGLQAISNQVISTSQVITIGSGGATAALGNDTSLGSLITATKGGNGGGASAPGVGGSGGGGSEGYNFLGNYAGYSGNSNHYAGAAGNTPSTSPVQGYAGGEGQSDGVSWAAGGGGGGAGGAGTQGYGYYPEHSWGGTGGAGVTSYSSWGLATGVGHNVSGTVYFASGGAGSAGGGAAPVQTGATNGGGGYGGKSGVAGGAGLANTGGGGGGGAGGTTGGSGVVIIRYLKTAVLPSTSSYELIGTINITSPQASVSFTGFPTSQYKHLQLRITARTVEAAAASSFVMQFNGDTGNNYSWHHLRGNGSSVLTGQNSATNVMYPGAINGNSATANAFSGKIIDILDFASPVKNTTIKAYGGEPGSSEIGLYSGAWYNTAPVTSLLIYASANFAAGCRMSLYGVRG